ncbi:hypothetical protein [Halanaerobium sp.]|jgi:hypothetical protein|uniref:hypothetical protein n=1 Tax=Halanaerobium sp. TaxID=1895664 RepID=UPI000DE72F34|nr:hypothetical protein [Halanaerobium sp.]PUU92912.1 MAG: hypothetical protein CI949_1503 [Halanaerobium sp.]
MFKKSVVLAIVMVMLVSFSAAVLAEELDGKAPNNAAGVEILVENEDGDREIHFMDAVNDKAKETDKDDDKGNPNHPNNPILVAGK